MCECQGCVNVLLDTSTSLMDTTSLDIVIIVDVQERCDLTLSQQISYYSHPLSNYVWVLSTGCYIHLVKADFYESLLTVLDCLVKICAFR